MSYDIYLRQPPCPHCGRCDGEPDCPDPTYNLSPIFDLALRDGGRAEDSPWGLRRLSERKASETVADIDRAIVRLTDPSRTAEFTALEPENKWGTLPDAVWVMKRLRELAGEHPDATWEVR